MKCANVGIRLKSRDHKSALLISRALKPFYLILGSQQTIDRLAIKLIHTCRANGFELVTFGPFRPVFAVANFHANSKMCI